jgi:hypothetical protein
MSEQTFHPSQIRPLSVDNSHIASSAAIATSKLADAVNFILRTGSVAFTADQSMGNNKLTNVATAVSGTDAPNLTQVNSLIAAIAVPFSFKNAVRLAATGNVNISAPGTSTFDGVTANTNDRIFLGNQTAGAQNGIYTFHGSGSAMVRATDFDAWTEIPAAFFAIDEGATLANTLWLNTNDAGGTLNTTAITFMQLPTSAGYSNSNFVTREVPAGALNGSNDTYTLANTPTAGSEEVFYNGMLLHSGAGNDYTISGGTITWIRATMPVSGDFIQTNYRK